MNEVEAVKNKEDISRISTLLLKHGSNDYADLWRLGIQLAYRISELTSIKYDDINWRKREVRVSILKKRKTVYSTALLNDTAVEIIKRRRKANPDDIYIFQSHGNRGKSMCKPLDRTAVARKFKEIGDIVNISLSTHSMRKTRGYMMFEGGVSIEQICKVLDQKNTDVTLAYIGITKENTMQTYIDFEL